MGENGVARGFKENEVKTRGLDHSLTPCPLVDQGNGPCCCWYRASGYATPEPDWVKVPTAKGASRSGRVDGRCTCDGTALEEEELVASVHPRD